MNEAIKRLNDVYEIVENFSYNGCGTHSDGSVPKSVVFNINDIESGLCLCFSAKFLRTGYVSLVKELKDYPSLDINPDSWEFLIEIVGEMY